VKEEDYFTIYFDDGNTLMDYFQKDLLDTGMAINVAKQHRNQVDVQLNKIIRIIEASFVRVRHFCHKMN
jgi:hypothetical protein